MSARGAAHNLPRGMQSAGEHSAIRGLMNTVGAHEPSVDPPRWTLVARERIPAPGRYEKRHLSMSPGAPQAS